jgi:hypothetical protein
MNIKGELFQYLWSDFKIADFENWLFRQDSDKFEELIGKDKYLDIISENFSSMTTSQIKKYIFNRFDSELKVDWDKFVAENYFPVIGICKVTHLLDYNGTKIRDWELKIAEKYEILEILKSSNKNDNHKAYVRYVDRLHDLNPSGLVPKDLFDINLEKVSDLYQIDNSEDSIQIKPKDWSDQNYHPVIYSFWEDFYDDEPKAVKTYYNTIDKLGIKNAW